MEENDDDEKVKRLKEISQKSQDLLAETMEVMLDDETREKIASKVKKTLEAEGSRYNLQTMIAFYEGMALAMKFSKDEDGDHMIGMVLGFLRGDIKKNKKKISEKATDAMIQNAQVATDKDNG